MSNTPNNAPNFIEEAESIVVANISNEQFGVSEMAELMHMSRSSLLRKIKKHTELSASQFIRQTRLAKGMEMLKENTLTVAEISYQVGFGNASYFIKCFREQYGYSPGDIKKGIVAEEKIEERVEEKTEEQVAPPRKNKWPFFLAGVLVIVVLVVFLFQQKGAVVPSIEKSIAVLPFKNESSDSLNLYFVNGLMESTLNNLQKVGDLRVVSRTSVSQYRNTNKSIPEIANELQVSYLVEGSGQRIGDQVLLHIKLIDAASDQPIWVEQYSRKVKDVFALQNEIAKKIADAIQAMVTPAEWQQIEKIPTKNMLAYDYYLQGVEYSCTRDKEGAEKSIPLFKKAIELDPEFALAHANIAISYYFLDVHQKQKKHIEQTNIYSDKALLYDSKSAESLIAKALYYMQNEEYNLALPHLEKALEYNPNSTAVVQMLSDLYARFIPNTSKYLEYALKGTQLNIANNDSLVNSYMYLHLSNALIQNGFIAESEVCVNKSINLNPDNLYAPLVNIFIQYSKNLNGEQAKEMLRSEWRKDTTRLLILQEMAKAHYYQQEYDSAFYYYQKFVAVREKQQLDIFPSEGAKIASVYKRMGLRDEAKAFFREYVAFCSKDETVYKGTNLAVQYAYQGDLTKALKELRMFAEQDNFQYQILFFLDAEPILEPLRSNSEFKKIKKRIGKRFWENHHKLKKTLENKGLL